MRITDVQLTAQEPKAAGRRYAEILGVPVTETGAQAALQVGGTRLVLVPGPVGPGVHHLAFTVPPARFARAVADVTTRVGLIAVEGRSVFEGPQHWNSSSVYFTGPDGALLEYIVRRDLSDDALARTMTPSSPVASISEVGVAVSDVAALLDQLKGRTGLEPFGPPSPDFAPVGDQHGLLICVSSQRLWYPQQQQRSGGGPLRVVMATERGTAELTLGSSGAAPSDPGAAVVGG